MDRPATVGKEHRTSATPSATNASPATRAIVIGSLGGAGTDSFVHVEAAARATMVALDRAKPGIYNIVDDAPARLREWLPAVAFVCDTVIRGGTPDA